MGVDRVMVHTPPDSWYVYLDERDTRGVDDGVYAGIDAGVDPHKDVLMSSLEDQIAYLWEENRRKDEIIMQQAVTMRQLTAPQEPRDAPETVPDTSEGIPLSDTVAAQEGAQEPGAGEETARRPWWVRWFRGQSEMLRRGQRKDTADNEPGRHERRSITRTRH